MASQIVSPFKGSTETLESNKKTDVENPEWLAIFLQYGLWPLVVLLLFSYYRKDIVNMLSNLSIRSVEAGGFRVEFDPRSAGRVIVNFEKSYNDFKRVADKEYFRQAHIYQLDEKLKLAVDAVREHCGLDDRIKDCRATIHVPDVVFQDYLYQLVNYYPSGGGRGRRFSMRLGIIGRTWRLGFSDASGDALDATQLGYKVSIENLVRYWGMREPEARASLDAKFRKSFICIVLNSGGKNSGEPVALMYMDAPNESVFVPKESDDVLEAGVIRTEEAMKIRSQRLEAIERDPRVRNLATTISEAMKALRESGTFLSVH